jgi:hypothetical protein
MLNLFFHPYLEISNPRFLEEVKLSATRFFRLEKDTCLGYHIYFCSKYQSRNCKYIIWCFLFLLLNDLALKCFVLVILQGLPFYLIFPLSVACGWESPDGRGDVVMLVR